ncbi:uncharacterized protein LOC116289278 [Actinia tenebrosa]|uniref:Uncharacterized protein LOC116289278 n=1 Tax=Actinia tenebrosa TaxID=6105 RepID=A0A6P8H6K8_ACTTE|nr:uncharacterized protein LOC116289278 [Actinia tenebrosa]
MAANLDEGRDEILVILEEISQANKTLREENKEIRNDLKKRDEENKKALADLSSQLSNRTNVQTVRTARCSPREARRQAARERRGNVPAQCRVNDFSGFYLDESVDSDNNINIVGRVVTEVYHQYGGQEKSPWCKEQIETVLRRYFLSLYEKNKQIVGRKYEAHKKTCRKNGRRRDKLTRRTMALEMVRWDQQKLGRVAEVLREDAMSSEDSDGESDENGGMKVTCYKVKRLSWEGERFTRAKKALDKAYKKSLTKRASDRVLPREEANNLSTREVPENFPEWALKI